MSCHSNIPESAYGILQRDNFDTEAEEISEQIRRLGYATIDSGLSPEDLENLSSEFECTRAQYVKHWGKERLQELDELNTIRAPLAHGGSIFLQLAMNPNLLSVLKQLIVGKFILNQQNAIINPPTANYNQGAWHRDLPYQHFVSSHPLALNALFCVDDFTSENGATFILPASHKAASFPSTEYIRKNALQVEAKAGYFILLDCMMFHAGGYNQTNKERRAVNHVYTVPYFKQQIKLAGIIQIENLTAEQQDLLGVNYQEPASIDDYLSGRSPQTLSAKEH